MKRFFNYALALAMVGTLSAGFVSCSEDEETPVETTKERQLQALSTTYVNDVVTKTYSNLANEAEKLYNLIAVLKTKVNAGTTVTQGEVDAICTSYKTARSHWEESEAWLYGAASDYEIDPSIDSWPLVVKALAEDLTNATKMAAISNTTGAEYIKAISDLAKENRGFHGLEFIFFRNGSNRLAKYFSKTEQEDDAEFAGKHITGEQEMAFAMATAAYLRDRCYQLEVAWLGDKAPAAHKARVAECEKVDPEAFGTKQKVNGQYYGQNMLAAGQGDAKSTYKTWRNVVEDILVSGCSKICSEVADQKMGQAYRSATGTAKPDDDPNYIESPYSYNSFTDFYGNIMSIQNALYGNINKSTYESNSIMAYLNIHNKTLATDLQAKLTAALAALKACQNSGTPFVKNPGAPVVKTAMDKIGELDEMLNTAASQITKN